MKKLSIILALIMALSCFSFVALAEPDTTEAAEVQQYDVFIKVIYTAAHPDGSYHDSSAKDSWVDSRIISYRAPKGTKLTAKDILNVVSNAAVNEYGKPVMVLDGKEFVLNDNVFLGDYVDGDVVLQNPTAMGSQVIGETVDDSYAYICYAAEIDDVDNFAQVAASELGGYKWDGVAKANVTLINELIKGFRAAVDSVIKDTANLDKSEKAVNGTTAASKSPATGASAVAGVAVVVLALSATTAVVLRKKED